MDVTVWRSLIHLSILFFSGLGYIVGAQTAVLAGDWRWGLRVTPFLGIVAVILIIGAMTDPPRGHSEGHGGLKPTTYTEDLKSLSRNSSFVLSTLAFTCVAFCAGSLSWWGPKYIEAAVGATTGGKDDPIMQSHGAGANLSINR